MKYMSCLLWYRARKINSAFKKEAGIEKQDLIYPKNNRAILNRANREKQSIFYCSLAKEPVFFELGDLHDNDELILTFWETTEKMVVNNIGYTHALFEQLGAKRICPTWTANNTNQPTNKYEFNINDNSISSEVKEYIYSHDENRIVREATSLAFMRHVARNNDYLYKLSVALAELHLGKITNFPNQFSGILYPSLRVGAEGDNLALLPNFVDDHLQFKKAVHIKIESKKDKQVKITCLDHAGSFSENGTLNWLGRLPQWQCQPNQEITCLAKEGIDDDGDYTVDPNGIRCHWVDRQYYRSNC